MNETAHIHNWSGYLPVIHIGEGFSLPTYFLIISLSFCACLLWLIKRVDRRRLSRTTAMDLSLLVMTGGFLGARLFHIFFEEPKYYFESPLRVLEFWKGGFVWYGGAVLGFALGLLYVRKQRLPLALWLDTFAPVSALGYGLGRIACVLAGCCYGAVCVLPSGFQFRYPTQWFSVAWEFAALGVLLLIERKRNSDNCPRLFLPAGRVFLAWVFLHTLGRLVMEHFRGDPRGPEPMGLSLSTWLSAAFILLVAFYAIRDYLKSRNS